MSPRVLIRRLPRSVRWVGGVVLLVALVVGAAHTPPARRLVLARAIRALEADGRLVVRASALHYNLLAGSLTLDDLAVSARETADRPFLRARHARAQASWRALLGPIRLSLLSMDAPRIEIVRDRQGRTNLPASATTGGQPAALPIERLHVTEAAVLYRDEVADVTLELPAIVIDLWAGGPGARGSLALTHPGTFRAGARATTIASTDGRLSWNGRTVGLSPATIVSPETTMSLSGTIDVLTATSTMDLDVRGWADLRRVSAWVPVSPPVEGRLTWTGHVGGAFDRPLGRVSVAIADAGWQTLRPVRIHGTLTANSNHLLFEEFQAQAAAGHANVTGQVDFHGATPLIEARGSWSDVDVGQLLDLAGTSLPVHVSSRADGRVSMRGPIDDAAKIEAEGEIVLREAGRTPAARKGLPDPPTGRLKPAPTDEALPYARKGRPEPALAVRGAMHASLASGRWRADAHLGTAAAVLNAEATGTAAATGATIDGRARVEVASLSETARALARSGVRLPAGTEGRGVLTATVRGPVRDPSFDLELTGDGLRTAGIPPATMSARAAGTLDRVRLVDANVAAGPNRLSARGTLAPRHGTVDLDVAGAVPDPAALTAALPEDVRPSGDLRLQGRVTGPLARPRVQATLDGRDVRAAGQRLDTLSAAVRLVGTQLTVDRFDARQGSGQITASGTHDLSRERFTMSMAAHGLHVDPLPERLSPNRIIATVDAQFDGSGTFANPVGHGSVTVTDARIDAEQVGRAEATVVLGGGSARVDLLMPDWQAHAQGSVGLAAPHPVDLTAAVLETDLARLLALVPGAPSNIRGTSTVTLHAIGDADRPEAMAAAISLEHLDATVGEVPVKVQRPAHATYARRAVTVDRFEASVGGSTVRASGGIGAAPRGPAEAGPYVPGSPALRTDAGVRLQVDARAEDLVALAAALKASPAGLAASGPVHVDALVGGTLDHLAVSGTAKVTDARVRSGELPEVHISTFDATFDPSRLTIGSLSAAWQDAALTGSASMPLSLVAKYLPPVLQPVPGARAPLSAADSRSGKDRTGGLKPSRYDADAPARSGADEPARLTLRATNIGPEVVRPFVDAATASRLGGRLSVSATLDSDALVLDHVRGSVQLDQLDVTVAELPIRQSAPTRIELANGFARVAQWSWTGEGAELNVVGQVRLADRMAALIATGTLDLRLLTPFLADSGVQTAGRLVPHIVVSGALDDVKVDGDVSVSGGELEMAEPALAATDVTARATLSRNRLDLVSLTGLLNGGTLDGHGWLTLRDFVPERGRLAFTARGVGLNVPRGLQTEADATLALTYTDGALALDGDTRVLHGAYREPIALTTGLLAALQAQTNRAAIGTAAPSVIDDMALDLRVSMDQDLRVDNNYGRFDLGGDLRLVGTVAQPAVVGRIIMREGGQILFGGRTYRLDRPGTIDFSDPFRIEPDVDISAVTHVVADRTSYDVTLRITGTPDTIATDLASDPPLSQTDIVSVLLTGRTADQAGGLQAQVAGQQLLGYLSGEFLGVAGRALGLDRLELGRTAQAGYTFDPGLIATETDPGSRLTFGKSIGRDVDVTLSQSLRQSGGLTWIIAYTPGRQMEVRFVQAEDNSRSYEFRHDVSFGRPRVQLAVAGDASPERRRSVPLVTRVQITGAAPEEERALVRRLSLKAGRRFDFQAWQGDRDRLAAFYVERGFLEAGVSARREERDDGVALTYGVDPGPKAAIDVQGFAVSDAVRGQLVEAWQHGVFDAFRRDSMARVVRTALAADGYLEPTVLVAFDSGPAKAGPHDSNAAPGPQEKVAHVTITPGPRITARAVRIEGVGPAQAAEYDAWLREVRLRDAAFDRPREVEGALTAHLRDAGHLAAAVAVARPVVEADTGVVVVHVDPGPVYHVSSLRVGSSRPGMDALLALPPALGVGAVYAPGQVALAQGALETAWRRAGFSGAKVGVETAIDPKRAEVAVAFHVEAGARQILEGVVVSGATGTRPRLVNRTIALPLRQPVSLESLFKARTRLSDTGIFRRVEVTPEPAGPPRADGDQPIRARVTVEEWPKYRLQYGFRGLDHQPEGPDTPRVLTPGFAADLTRRDLFGAGMTTGASLRAQARAWEGRGFWSAPTLFGHDVTSTFYVARGRQEAAPETGGFVTDDLRTTLEQRFRLPHALRLFYGYNFTNTHVFDPNATPGDPFAFDLRLHIARLNSSLLLDTRDNPDDTHRGFFHSSTFEYASPRLGSELLFTKYNLQQYVFRPIHDIVFASAARLGVGFGTEGRPLILTERFFAGGGRTVRGYPEEGLGPRDVFGRAAGGDAMLVLNQEVRVPLYRWVSGVGFLDAGNVFAKVGDLSLRGLKVGAGGGLRFQTPIVLLRIDYGVPLGTITSRRRGAWVFSIGQAF